MRAGGGEKTNDEGWGRGERIALFEVRTHLHSLLRCNNCLLSHLPSWNTWWPRFHARHQQSCRQSWAPWGLIEACPLPCPHCTWSQSTPQITSKTLHWPGEKLKLISLTPPPSPSLPPRALSLSLSFPPLSCLLLSTPVSRTPSNNQYRDRNTASIDHCTIQTFSIYQITRRCRSRLNFPPHIQILLSLCTVYHPHACTCTCMFVHLYCTTRTQLILQ